MSKANAKRCRHPQASERTIAYATAVDGSNHERKFSLTQCAICGENRRWTEIEQKPKP